MAASSSRTQSNSNKPSSPFSSSSSSNSFVNRSSGYGSRSDNLNLNRTMSDSVYSSQGGYGGYGGEYQSADEMVDDVARPSAGAGGDSISVTIRFRPLSEQEYQRGDEVAWYADGDKLVRNEYNPATSYAFDKVFGEYSETQEVYDVAAGPVIKAAMEGINGTFDIDFEKEPIGVGKHGKDVYFRDIWPSTQEVADAVQSSVLPDMFKSTYQAITKGNPMWNDLSVEESKLYSWDPQSTYIHEPSYFKNMTMNPPGAHGVKDAYCLLNFGDSITTYHISPAGSIQKDSPAARFLLECGFDRKDFNSYGSRRGNDEIMARGTFANIRIVDKMAVKWRSWPENCAYSTGEKLSVFDAASRYKAAGQDSIVLAGAGCGSGSSRDWAAKGPMLLGVKAVIAKSFERIHRINLVGMGIIPLCFMAGEDADTLQLTGHERFNIYLPSNISEIRPGQDVTVTTDTGKSFTCTARFDTEV